MKPLKSYRCEYVPTNAMFESGATQWVQVKATDAADAMVRAARCIGRPIIHVSRYEPAEVSA